MYCIRKYADCWMIFNLESELGRRLTDEEIRATMLSIPSLCACDVVSYFSDEVNCIEDKP